MEVESDEEIWQRVLSGNGRAFGVIWDRHHGRVMRHLVLMGKASAEAEDLNATVFLELWRRRDEVRVVEGSLLPWLIVTAHNVHRNALRAHRRYHRFLASLPPPDNFADHAELIAEQNDVRVTQLRDAMRGCSSLDAALLALTALEGFTSAEAGASLGLTEAAAKMRIRDFGSGCARPSAPTPFPKPVDYARTQSNPL